MKYFITMEAGGELRAMDSQIIYLQKGDTIMYKGNPFLVEWKILDVDRNYFIVAVTPNFL